MKKLAVSLISLGLLCSCGGGSASSSESFSLSVTVSGNGTVDCYYNGQTVTEDNFAELLTIGDTLTIRATAEEGSTLTSGYHNGAALAFSSGVSSFVVEDGLNSLTVTFDEVATQVGDFTFSEPVDGEVSVTSYSPSTTTIPSPVIIPDSVEIDGTEYLVTSVGERAFYNSGVTKVQLGANISSVDSLAFSDASALYYFLVDEDNETFEAVDGILYAGETLVRVPEAYADKEVEVREGTTEIASYGFGSTNVTSVIFPDTVTTIGDYGFYYAKSLTDLELPNSLRSIGQYGFGQCNALGSLSLPEGLEEMGYAAFYQSGLTSLTLPGTLEEIPDYCFYFNRSLRNLTFNEGLKSIGMAAFSSASISSLSFPSTLESIGQGAFDICTSLSEVSLNEGLLEIGNYAFDRSTLINSIHIPSTVTRIGINPFSGLTRLGYGGNFTIAEGNEHFVIEDSVLYQVDDGSKQLLCYPTGKTDSTFEIPEGTTHLLQESFVYQRSVTDVTLPKSLVSIDQAFVNMYSDSTEELELTLRYNGTLAEFALIDLNEDNGSFYEGTTIAGGVVICTDGEYVLE